MNRHKNILVILLVCSVLLLGTVDQAAASATMTPFTGTEVYVSELSPGEIFSSDGNMHIRGIVQSFAATVSDPRVTGLDTVTINGNFKLVAPPVSFMGQMWGTFRISNGDGYWEGTWTGVRAENGFSYMTVRGEGYGEYEGMKIFMDVERLSPDPTQPEILNGYILEPGN
jgi:hypothetical protein